jgi:hypothetical protein
MALCVILERLKLAPVGKQAARGALRQTHAQKFF